MTPDTEVKEYPSIEPNILRVVIHTGEPYHLSAMGVRCIEPALSCCGGEPAAAVVMVTSRVYITLHPYSIVKALYDGWKSADRGRGA